MHLRPSLTLELVRQIFHVIFPRPRIIHLRRVPYSEKKEPLPNVPATMGGIAQRNIIDGASERTGVVLWSEETDEDDESWGWIQIQEAGRDDEIDSEAQGGTCDGLTKYQGVLYDLQALQERSRAREGSSVDS